MSDARAIPDAVQWHEGMLLSPQHFQQADLRAQGLQSYLALAAAPFLWGVRRLAIDRAALVEGIFAVTDLEAIMPDGLLIRYPSDRHAPSLRIDLRAVPNASAGGPIAVHATVAVRSPFAQQTGELQRFRSVVGDEVVDENTGDNAMPIPRLVPVLGLHCTDGPLRPPPNHYVSLPLAVVRSGGQGFQALDYEAPRFRVERDTLLFGMGQYVAEKLRRKAKSWGEMLYGALFRGRANVAGNSLATLRTLVRGLPRLEALLQTGAAHPFDVYLALCDIAGDLAVGGDGMMLPPAGDYAHGDPLAAYTAVAKAIDHALSALRTPHRSVVFNHPSPGRFELMVQAEYLAETLVIGARIGPGQDAPTVVAWFEQAMIGPASRIPAMRLNRVNGAARTVIASAPELDLVPPPNILLFRVRPEPGIFGAAEPLQVSVPAGERTGEPEELELFLPSDDPARPAPGA